MTRPWLSVGRLRLASGLVLFAFICTHFANHALGLVSLDAMEAGRQVYRAIWMTPPAQMLLLLALAVHFALALLAIYRRRRLLAMPRWEAVQLVAGLLIVPQIAEHAIETAGASALHGSRNPYALLVWWLSIGSPGAGIRQAIVLVAAWLHGCLGLWFRLKLRPWYPRYAPLLLTAALLVPLLALGGFIAAAREVSLLAQNAEWRAAMFAAAQLPDDYAAIEAAVLWTRIGFVGLVALALGARVVRTVLERRRGLVRIAYPDRREVAVPPGTSVLEASQTHGIPHAHVCGGRGRCSTCRVRIVAGGAGLPGPEEQEARVLARVGSAPNVRLACQIRPTHDLAVVPLLPPTASAADAWARPGHLQGREMEIAILFADIRGFTAMSEQRLPYDVVFILNRYFLEMGRAIEQSGGHLDKFIGDGVMALFGIERGPRDGARAALAAARAMSEALDRLNEALAQDLGAGIRIGIGIHLGPAIVGEMGYGNVKSVTAIGDSVNTASRLESMTKEFAVELVVSDSAARAAGIDLDGFPRHEATVRGRADALVVYAIKRGHDLPAAPTARQSIAASAR